MTISKLIQKLRIEKNMTMVELAQNLGCSQASISQWESGTSDPSPKYIKKLSELFGVNFEQINNTDNIVSEPSETYDVDSGNNLGSVVLNLSESNKIMSESNKNLSESTRILSESNKILSESIQKAIEMQKKVIEHLSELKAVHD